MALYLAMRIIQGKLEYVAVTTLYPQFKADIDSVLVSEDKQNLIVS